MQEVVPTFSASPMSQATFRCNLVIKGGLLFTPLNTKLVASRRLTIFMTMMYRVQYAESCDEALCL